MIAITNDTNEPITRANVNFKPGQNLFEDEELTQSQIVQIKALNDLTFSWEPNEQGDESTPKKKRAK